MKNKLPKLLIIFFLGSIFLPVSIPGQAYGLSAESLKTLDAGYRDYICKCCVHHKKYRKCYCRQT